MPQKLLQLLPGYIGKGNSLCYYIWKGLHLKVNKTTGVSELCQMVLAVTKFCDSFGKMFVMATEELQAYWSSHW